MIRNRKIAVHCSNQEEAILFLKTCENLGYHWKDGSRFSKNDCWSFYKEKTCYNVFEGTFSQIELYKADGFTIMKPRKFCKFLFSSNFIKDDLKRLDKVLVRNNPKSKWQLGTFEKYDKSNLSYPYITLIPHHQSWAECVSFNDHEDWLNTY